MVEKIPATEGEKNEEDGTLTEEQIKAAIALVERISSTNERVMSVGNSFCTDRCSCKK